MLFWGLIALLIVLRMRASRGAARSELNQAAAPIAVQRWNPFAILGIALSFYVLLVPLVFGIVALVQISRSGDRGRVLAIIAIAVQSVGLLGLVWYVASGDLAPAGS